MKKIEKETLIEKILFLVTFVLFVLGIIENNTDYMNWALYLILGYMVLNVIDIFLAFIFILLLGREYPNVFRKAAKKRIQDTHIIWRRKKKRRKRR